MKTGSLVALWLVLLTTGSVPMCGAADVATSPRQLLLDAKTADARFKPTSSQVSVTRSQAADAPGFVVSIQPGKEGYPGVNFQPEGGVPWDLSAYGHVEARVVNCGSKGVSVTLRLDNGGDWRDNPYNAEAVYLKPGETGTVSTIFGFSYGRQPGYALNPKAIVNVLLFAMKSEAAQCFRIEWIAAAGPAGEKPPVDPKSVRVKPEGGMLVPSVMVHGGESFKYPAPGGARWDLRDYLEVRALVRNLGMLPVTPRLRVVSDRGSSDWVTGAVLAPGKSNELVVSFIDPVPWQGQRNKDDSVGWGNPKTGNKIANDAVSAVEISGVGPKEAVFYAHTISAALPPAPVLPSWVGQRPPVEGDWVKTFDEDFNGPALDGSKWRVTGPNYWDKTSHWSTNNAILGGGVFRLRYEKKTGPHNDDPREKSSSYTSGYLDTYGKWTQRYGYFEARMKLPAAPGLWPAFWMMPDRGAQGKEQWQRQDTGNGGMEFDVMEHLTRWGPMRYNIAMHWDGYGNGHKQTGSPFVYVQPDKEGFITAGLLWLPGLAVFYGNGVEVARWEDPRICSVPCDMMFTLPTGGWDNNRLDDKQLPADFVIDYVRAWQRRDLVERK